MKPRHLIPALLCALLVGYPLSIGPVGWWYHKHYARGSTPPGWVVIYGPLDWAVDHSTTLGKAMDWYGQMWGWEDY